MNKIPLWFLKLMVAITLLVAVSSAIAACSAKLVNAVTTQERVINLPQDQAKWYISVVGNKNSPRYKELLLWFDSNENLKNLKDQVHFKQVTSDTMIFQERYKANILGLPTVRMQKADGTRVFEAAGVAIPTTADGLFKKMISRPMLPWRERMENRPCPDGSCPEEKESDPLPQPINYTGPPEVVDNTPSTKFILGLSALGLLGGGVAGGVARWRKVTSDI